MAVACKVVVKGTEVAKGTITMTGAFAPCRKDEESMVDATTPTVDVHGVQDFGFDLVIADAAMWCIAIGTGGRWIG